LPGAKKEAGEQTEEEIVKRLLSAIEKEFGEVPFISSLLSSYPDIFIPYANLTDRVLTSPRHMDKKSVELAAIAAGSALRGEHCLAVHIRQAKKFGASKEEIMEAAMVGSFMAMTAAQSVVFRKIKDVR